MLEKAQLTTYDHIDMIGFSGAYSSHTPNSTFTTGLVLTKG